MDDPVSPGRDGKGGGLSLALRASVTGLAQGSYRLSLTVTHPDAEGNPSELTVNPEVVRLTAGADPAPQSFTVDMSPCPQGCLLTATLTLSDDTGELASHTLELGLVRPGDQLSPADLIQLVPSYTLTIRGGGAGTGSGTITVPEAGGQPPLSCAITDGQEAGEGCTGQYALHTILALTATEGLTAWGGDCSSSAPNGPCELTMDDHRSAGASFAAQPTTGVLIVQIGGLPSGTAASVTVTNGRGYSATVSRTDTLSNLSPGNDYSLAAQPVQVSAEGRAYNPSPSTQAVTIVAGDTTLAQVGYNPPETGSLALAIFGQTGGIAVQVLVSGPSLGQPVSVSTDSTLSGLDPGTYAIVATAVGEGAPFGPYIPTPPRQEVEVASSQTAQATVAYAATHGAMTVAISGLPASTVANVFLTGPDGSNRLITGTGLVPQLAPGDYVVTSGNVTTPGHTYAPDQPIQVIEVLPGTEVSVPVGYSALPPAILEKVKGDSATCLVNSFCDDLFEVRARDSTGNVVSGATVRWTAGDPSPGCPSGSHTDVSTDPSGIAKASNQCKYPTPGVYHQTAALVVGRQVVPASQVSFIFSLTVGPVSPSASRVQVSIAALRTCCDTASVTVTALDASGNPIAGALVVLAASGAGAIPIQPSAPTDANGVTAGALTARTTGVKTVTATINGTGIDQNLSLSVIAGIAYTSGEDNGAIIAVNTDGSRPFDLTTGRNLDVDASAWAPDGSRIAFSAFPSCPPGNECFDDSDIYVMNADGSDLVNLTDAFGFNSDFNPAWSPDGHRIAFTRVDCAESSCNSEIYIIDATGSPPVNLTNSIGRDDDHASWSADDRIVFDSRSNDPSCECTLPRDLYVVSATGSDTVNLTHSEADEREPEWSPEGKRILFVLDNVYVMDRDGSNPVAVTHDSELSYSGPTWSPDGRTIAFSTGIIRVMSLDGAVSQVFDATQGGLDPTWR